MSTPLLNALGTINTALRNAIGTASNVFTTNDAAWTSVPAIPGRDHLTEYNNLGTAGHNAARALVDQRVALQAALNIAAAGGPVQNLPAGTVSVPLFSGNRFLWRTFRLSLETFLRAHWLAVNSQSMLLAVLSTALAGSPDAIAALQRYNPPVWPNAFVDQAEFEGHVAVYLNHLALVVGTTAEEERVYFATVWNQTTQGEGRWRVFVDKMLHALRNTGLGINVPIDNDRREVAAFAHILARSNPRLAQAALDHYGNVMTWRQFNEFMADRELADLTLAPLAYSGAPTAPLGSTTIHTAPIAPTPSPQNMTTEVLRALLKQEVADLVKAARAQAQVATPAPVHVYVVGESSQITPKSHAAILGTPAPAQQTIVLYPRDSTAPTTAQQATITRIETTDEHGNVLKYETIFPPSVPPNLNGSMTPALERLLDAAGRCRTCRMPHDPLLQPVPRQNACTWDGESVHA
jgi:hypothetical protein